MCYDIYMSMKNEFQGQTVGFRGDGYQLWSLFVEHDGEKFLVDVWAQNETHAVNLLAAKAAARHFYRVLDVAPWAPLDLDLETA